VLGVTGDEPDWWSVLRVLDEPGSLGEHVGLEVPRDFDRAATQARFDRLAERLSEAYGCPLVGGAGPQQDAAFFGRIRIPAEVSCTRTKHSRTGVPLTVIVSNFGGLATYLPFHDSSTPPAPPVHREDRKRIEEVLIRLGYRVVPGHVLATTYDGPNEWVFGSGDATWFVRFFDYL
jgi:hypothetical protein